MKFSQARQQLYQAIRQPQVDLAAAALYIAQEEYPELEVDAYLNALDTMAEEIAERLPSERYPLRWVNIINQYLFEDLQFRGNTDNYYDPRNSFLNDVIDRRIGIPITLSLVYLELTRRLDFPMVGVGFPGHFLIRPDQEEIEIHVDPFHQGEVLFEQDCLERLIQIYGPTAQLQPAFFQSVSPQQFLVRMLSNLKHIYLSQSQFEKCLSIIELILLITPTAPEELRDRGILYYQLGRWPEACQDLEDYLASNPPVEEIRLIDQLLTRMRKQR